MHYLIFYLVTTPTVYVTLPNPAGNNRTVIQVMRGDIAISSFWHSSDNIIHIVDNQVQSIISLLFTHIVHIEHWKLFFVIFRTQQCSKSEC